MLPLARAGEAAGDEPKGKPMLPTLMCRNAVKSQMPQPLDTDLPVTEKSERGTAKEGSSAVARGWHSKALIREHVDAEVSQRYDIDPRQIGAGGYGRVFLATDRVMKGRQVAIKKVVIRESDMRAGFRKEVEIMKDLDHPNVCKVFESYDQGRTVYLVMEYLDGGELLDRILDQEVIDEPSSADIVHQVASALKYAHGRGIAHRDLKPENIVFCSRDPLNNHVKVIDWGIGCYFGLRRMRTMVGSFAYTAPEVLASDGCYTAACDLWSLGVITYIMLCGQPPFSGSSESQQFEQIKDNPCPMCEEAWDTVSGPAKDLVRGLLSIDPAKRLDVDDVLAHPWLRIAQEVTDGSAMDGSATHQILSNMRRFSKTTSFFSLCAASVARHLDHGKLHDMRQVFREMDENGDGVLQLREVRAGFERIFGKGSAQLRDVDEMFERLDLDGSGAVDYTEFVAAGLGERMSTEVDALWAAFKTFDVHDGDGKLSKDELVQVLVRADADQVWSRDVVERWLDEIFDKFDSDGDGMLDFDEFLHLMRELEQHRSPRASITPKGGTLEDAAASSTSGSRPSSPGGPADGGSSSVAASPAVSAAGSGQNLLRPPQSPGASSGRRRGRGGLKASTPRPSHERSSTYGGSETSTSGGDTTTPMSLTAFTASVGGSWLVGEPPSWADKEGVVEGRGEMQTEFDVEQPKDDAMVEEDSWPILSMLGDALWSINIFGSADVEEGGDGAPQDLVRAHTV